MLQDVTALIQIEENLTAFATMNLWSISYNNGFLVARYYWYKITGEGSLDFKCVHFNWKVQEFTMPVT